MAPIKRKGEASASQPDNNSRKRQRKDGKDSGPKPKQSKVDEESLSKKASDAKSPPKQNTSFLTNSNEPPAFPRGGASALTPVERKQIQVQATRDVLFEQKNKGASFSDSELDSEPDGEAVPLRSDKKRSSKKSKQKTKSLTDKSKRDLRIEGLNYKRIVPGSIILGQVSSINARDVSVSLPNNLTGFVPLTSISSQLTSKIETLLNEAKDNEHAEGESDTEDDIDLKDYVRVGQYLRVYVSSTGSDAAASGAQKKHIELSLAPTLCNQGMKRDDVVVNSTLQAAVHSVEDHGLIMDLGLEEENVRGFIATKELGDFLQLSEARPGMVFLCHVMSSDSRTIKLSLDKAKLGNVAKYFVGTAPTINCFLPGTAVEILLSEVTSTGMAGKVIGTLDVTADMVHSTARKEDTSLLEAFRLGQKIKGRLISTFPSSDTKKLGFSLLEHILRLESPVTDVAEQSTRPALSDIVPDAVVSKVDPGMGLYLSLDHGDFEGFAHISSLSDKKIDEIAETTGPYKVGTSHKARITGYSAFDDLFLLSLQESVLSRPFLRLEDVKVGQVVKGKIQKLLISEHGVNGILVDLTEGITGLVPRIHMSDAQLQHPERKFREGAVVTVRVLSVDPSRKQLRLTLKKSLVNSESECWKDYKEIEQGHLAPGTLVKVDPHGAVVQFFGSVRGYLPVAEMSEAFIKDATQHFKEGQVVTVNALHVDPDLQKLTVSCRDPQMASSKESIERLKVGTLVSATVFEKSDDDVLLRLEGSDAIGRLELDHIVDGSEKKRRSALSKMRVGQKVQDLLILEVLERRRIVRMSNKNSLVQAAKSGELLTDLATLREGKKVTGFAVNVTNDGVFVCYAAGITGFLAKKQIPAKDMELPEFGITRLQPVSANILSIDYKGPKPRFWLTQTTIPPAAKTTNGTAATVSNPIDESITSLEDLSVGTVTKARIVSVKDTQLNVELAKDVQGRIDVSEIFDNWSDIKDRKRPLRSFYSKQILSVRILGAHDARNHRFLPITHRAGKVPVFELCAKPSIVQANSLDILTLDKVKVGSSWIAYVNNIAENYLWVNLSSNVRGRIAAMDVTDDLSLLGDIEANFPIGSALKVHVTNVDLEKNRLDLSAKPLSSSGQVTLKDISKGMILPGRVTKVSERQILVQLSDTIVGSVNLIDIADDYNDANPLTYQKNDVVRVCVLAVDVPNKKLLLSLRPSRVLSSSLTVKDPEITSIDQVHVNDVRRGFITNVTEKGVFIALGSTVTAFVRVSNLSDQFLKDWQEHFQRDQLVTGKIIAADSSSNHVQMSLKDSVLKADYKPPLTFNDLEVGQIVTGKVAKVEEFGVFIVVDNSSNVRGLCHRSEIAEQRVQDVRTLFSEGDSVKAKVLKIEPEKRRVNFGLKAAYFNDEDQNMEDANEEDLSDDGLGGVGIEAGIVNQNSDEEEAEDKDGEEGDEGIDMSDAEDADGVDSEASVSEHQDLHAPLRKPTNGLNIGGFDWAGLDGSTLDKRNGAMDSDTESVATRPKKKKKSEAVVDRTGDLDVNGPQSADDFERLLLSDPDSSLLWLQYMAFRLELGEIDQARQLGQRAVQTIGLGLDSEKLNVWVAMLNLENTYGDDDAMTEIFKKACEYNDPEEIHGRLASIYIQSGKLIVSNSCHCLDGHY